MKMKCVFRDVMGWVRIIDFEADSLEDATVGLHDRCREVVNAVESVDKSQMMVWLEYLISESGDHYRIVYNEGPFSEAETAALQSLSEKTVLITEPVFEHKGDTE